MWANLSGLRQITLSRIISDHVASSFKQTENYRRGICRRCNWLSINYWGHLLDAKQTPHVGINVYSTHIQATRCISTWTSNSKTSWENTCDLRVQKKSKILENFVINTFIRNLRRNWEDSLKDENFSAQSLGGKLGFAYFSQNELPRKTAGAEKSERKNNPYPKPAKLKLANLGAYELVFFPKTILFIDLLNTTLIKKHLGW